MYAHYEPVGINNWSLMLSVPESVGFEAARTQTRLFYAMSIFTTLVLSMYFILLFNSEKKENKKRMARLGYVEYVLDVEKTLFDAHKNPENVTKALKIVAEKLTAEKSFFIVLDGKEVSEVYGWNFDDKVREVFDNGNTEKLFADLVKCSTKIDYSSEAKKFGVKNYAVTIVLDSENKPVGILGTANMNTEWKSADLLENVSLAFSLFLNNLVSYRTICEMGIIDSLTSLNNRNGYQLAIEGYKNNIPKDFACVYIDVNGLHTLNNTQGHDAGDEMLRFIAKALKNEFGIENSYRIGGDEFIAFSTGKSKCEINKKLAHMKQVIEVEDYHISVGVEFSDGLCDVETMIRNAEQLMIDDKYEYYQKRNIDNTENAGYERLSFYDSVFPRSRGIYIVDPQTDMTKSVYVPEHFKKTLEKTGGKFSKAMKIYVDERVSNEYQREFNMFFDYNWIDKQVADGNIPSIVYRRVDGIAISLKVVKSPDYGENNKETVWLFEDLD